MAKHTNQTRPVYSYQRFSSAEQGQGDSRRRQTDAAEQACLDHGWTLADHSVFVGGGLVDEGVSAFRGRNRTRGQLAEFLSLLRDGRLEPSPVLILEDLDRLSRSKIMPSMDMIRQIIENGCDVYCTLTRRLYTRTSLDDPMSLLEMLWRFYLAHEESQKKSERSRQNWSQRLQHRKIKNTICPGWLKAADVEYDGRGRLTGGKFVPIPDKVSIVEKIFDMCINGLGTKAIVSHLNQTRVPSYKGKGWGQKTVFSILRDRRVLGELPAMNYGEVVTKAESVQGYYPLVISEDTFNAANLAMDSRKGKCGRPGGFSNLFTGIVHYPEHDDCTMVMINKAKVSSNRSSKGQIFPYRYLFSIDGFKGKRKTSSVPYHDFERCVLEWVTELRLDDAKNTGNGKLEALTSKVNFLTKRLSELADQLADPNANVPTVVQAVSRLEASKTTAVRELEEYRKSKLAPELGDVQSVVQVLATATGVKLAEYRQRLKSQLKTWLDRIDVAIQGTFHDRNKVYYLTIRFRSGQTRKIFFSCNPYQSGPWEDTGDFPGEVMLIREKLIDRTT